MKRKEPPATGGGGGGGGACAAKVPAAGAKLRAAASATRKDGGAAVCDALLELLGHTAALPPSSAQLQALNLGMTAMAKHVADATLRRVRELAAQHLAALCINVRGVDVPACVATELVQFLPNRDRAALARASRDWNAVHTSTQAWPSLDVGGRVKFHSDSLLSLVGRPQYRGVRALRFPSSMVTTKKGFFAALLRACPLLVSFDLSRFSSGLKPAAVAELVGAVPSPRSVRVFLCCGSPALNAPVFGAFTALQALSLGYWVSEARDASADALAAAFGAIGALAHLRYLTLRQHDYQKGALTWPNFTRVDDDVLAPVAAGCAELRQLNLENMFGVRARTFKTLAARAKHLHTVAFGLDQAHLRTVVPAGWLVESIREIVQLPGLRRVVVGKHGSTVNDSAGSVQPQMDALGEESIDALLRWQAAEPAAHREVMLSLGIQGLLASSKDMSTVTPPPPGRGPYSLSEVPLIERIISER